MNIIDKKFERLVSEIKGQSLDEVYQVIRGNYDKVNPNIQVSLEDFINKFLYWGVLKKSDGNYEELLV